MYAHLFCMSWEGGVVFVCQPCSRCSGPVDRSVGYRTTGLCVWDAAAEAGAWAPYCVLGAAVERRRCVGIVRNTENNVCTSELLELYLGFCILDAVLMYFTC